MISIIIPFYNEEENLAPLHKELATIKGDYEFVFVNDGSTDRSQEVIGSLKDARVKSISLRRRHGKGEALAQGVQAARGDILIFMDADLQDDPKYIRVFIDKLKEGYDFVNGARSTRQDNALIRLYSGLFNWFIRAFLHSPYSDINCGFKAFRREVLEETALYGNNFRFFPLAAHLSGFKTTQIGVENRPRRHGKSKFGPGKIFIGVFDTLTAYFLFRFAERPLHFFGIFGGIFFLAGFLMAAYLSYERIFHGVLLFRRPALLFAALLIIVGVQIIATGIIGELIVFHHKRRK